MKTIIFGLGGFCEDCNPLHDHPLNNIIEEIDGPDPEPTSIDTALEKLKALGLTESEVNALLGMAGA